MLISKLIRFLFFIVFTSCPVVLYGQYYNLGQDPASLKWREIVTPHFRILYPESFELKAHKMTPTLDYIYKHGAKTLSFEPKRVPLIMHNYNIVPNAVTAWAPARVEMFTSPPQDTYAQDWLDQLMIHEFRHVVQIDRTNQGFTKGLSWLTGELAAPLMNGLFVPSWFMEGDAVCTETALSHSGRGRVPGFEMPLRTQVTEVGAFSYDKATLGSYKNFVPNAYELGYTLVANVRRKYTYNSWLTALNEVARKPFVITPFNNGLKKSTGYRKEQLYRMTMHEMDSMWKYQDSKTKKTEYSQLSVIKKIKYENYKYPFYINDTMVIAEYTSIDDITRFVIVGPNGIRKIICTPGYLSSEIYSVVNCQNKKEDKMTPGDDILIAWTELISDPRWEQRTYSIIRIYDGNTGKIRDLTRNSRYFAPAFSPDGMQLAAVRVDPAGISSIVLIDVLSGNETDTIISSEKDFYMTPSWSKDGKNIVFTRLDGNGKSINIFNLGNRVLSTIIPATFIEISNPVFANDYVLFNGSFSGIENIHAVDLRNNVVYQVTSAEFGAGFATLSHDGKRIVYSNYLSTGYGLAEIGFKPGSWKRENEINNYAPSLFKYLVAEENSIVDSTLTKGMPYQSKPYKKIAHIFNFNSWAPAYINYMEGVNGLGVSVMSQNDLSTATTVIGYKYDYSENTGKVTADFSWQGWYPVVDLNASYGLRAAYSGGDTSVRYTFNETIISGGFSLPLVFMGGKYYRGLNLKVYTSWNDITNNTSPEDDKLTGTIHSFGYKLFAYRYLKQSYKDLYPRWGQSLSFTYQHTPTGDNNLGSIAALGTRLFFPGIFLHHGIRTDFNIQLQNPGQYTYSNQINLPRGYDYIYAEQLLCFAVNYKFPFAYPDFSAGPIAYFKRFNANLFVDGGSGVTDEERQKLLSCGTEIISTLNLLRLPYPMDIGIRVGYLPLEKQYFTNFLFSVNLPN